MTRPLNYQGPGDDALFLRVTALHDACQKDGEVSYYCCCAQDTFYFRAACCEGHMVDVRVASDWAGCMVHHFKGPCSEVEVPFDGTYRGLCNAVALEASRLESGSFRVEQALGWAKQEIRARGEDLPATEPQMRFINAICETLQIDVPSEVPGSVSVASDFIAEHKDAFYESQQNASRARAMITPLIKGLLADAYRRRGFGDEALLGFFHVKKIATVRRYQTSVSHWWEQRGVLDGWADTARHIADALACRQDPRWTVGTSIRTELRDQLLEALSTGDQPPDILDWHDKHDLSEGLLAFVPAPFGIARVEQLAV